MENKEKLVDILQRMSSDYIPEQKAAVDEFMQEGFSTKILFDIINKNPQPNLVSMFFYISGKRSDEETLNAWNYLRYRFEQTPDKFICNDNKSSYNPKDLADDDYRYLLYAARKYLIIKNKINVFLKYLQKIQIEASAIVKDALSRLDIELDNIYSEPYNDYNERIIFSARSEACKFKPEIKPQPTRRNLTNYELDIISLVSTLDDECCNILHKQGTAILFFRQWLIHFFLLQLPYNMSLNMFFDSINKEQLIDYVGYNEYVINIIIDGLNKTNKYSKDKQNYKIIIVNEKPSKKSTNKEIKKVEKAFQEMRDYVLTFSFDDFIIEADKKSIYPNRDRQEQYFRKDINLYNKYMDSKQSNCSYYRYDRPYFPDIPCPYYKAIEKLKNIFRNHLDLGFTVWDFSDDLYEQKDIDFCLDLLNRAEEIFILSFEEDKHNYENAVIDTNLYYYFKQTKKT